MTPKGPNRMLDEFARLMTDAAGAAQGVRREVETAFRAQGERLINQMDLVQREEFEAVRDMAAKARARLAAMPTRESAPDLFNPRSVGRPGCLDSDLFLPFSVRVNLAGLPVEQVVTGCYSAPLLDGAVYDIGRSRFDRIWLTRRSTGHCSDMAIRKLRGLRDLGRLVPVEREAARKAA